VRWIWPDPIVRGRLFVAIEAGALIRSLDGGQHWLDRVEGGPYDTHVLVGQADDPDHLYVAAGDGYYESRDGGATWHQPQEGLAHRYLFDIAISSRGPGRILVSASRDPWSAYSDQQAESYLYSRLPGEPWAVAAEGLPAPAGTTISALAAAHTSGFHAVNNHGVFQSDDGLTWRALPVAWPEGFRCQRVKALLALQAEA
jgi:hypothetical protein